jgi:hypothetical protein
MPLVMNGVIIPENVANAFMFNGVSVTDAFMNGVQVFNQSLFSATWSGSTIDGTNGLTTSGATYRWSNGSRIFNWLTANSYGLASGTSSSTDGTIYGLITTTPTTFELFSGTYNIGTITFSKTSGFSGTSTPTTSNVWLFETSSGLLRYRNKTTGATGIWISLT